MQSLVIFHPVSSEVVSSQHSPKIIWGIEDIKFVDEVSLVVNDLFENLVKMTIARGKHSYLLVSRVSVR